MSLVAYEYSSDGDSESDDTEEVPEPATNERGSTTTEQRQTNGHDDTLDRDDVAAETHLHLPAPKKVTNSSILAEDEDDEFLRKKAIPEGAPSNASTSKPKTKNGKVQITVPSLRQFHDDETGGKPKPKPMVGAALPNRKTNLLSMLPKPRSEMLPSFHGGRPVATTTGATVSAPISKRLIPDSVANRPRNPVAPPKAKPTATAKGKPSTVRAPIHDESDDDDDDDNDGDGGFFSFNDDNVLPEISINEINAMVAKRAAKIAETVRKYDEPSIPENATQDDEQMAGPSVSVLRSPTGELANEQALSALIGGNKAKRARTEQVDIIDISSEDIVPSKDDFMRRKLQDETGYVPTGHLVGDWTCTSKRKSHITYLAAKAQANSQELEAMWASNRQSRRQTQSKYGF